MAAHLGDMLRHLHRLAGAPADDGLTDGQLLERFRANRDEAAFAALVQRHGPMVLAACRRLLPRAHDAEDAFQAVFFVLARRAVSIQAGESVAGYLYGVACRVALRARGREARSRERERRAATMARAEPVDELTLRELRAVLDEELGALPDKYRTALVLCYLEGKTHEQAARELGCPRTSLSSRLGRARGLLRRRLERRGLLLTAGVLAGALGTASAPAAVPAPLAIAAVGAGALAASGRAGAAGLVSPRAVALAKEALDAMAPARVKLLAGLVLGLGLACVGAGLLRQRSPAAALSDPAPGEAGPPAAQAADGPDVDVKRSDRHGDPLPPGAVARLGTVRFRVPDEVEALAFAPDGKTLAVSSRAGLFLLDAGTGRRLRHLATARPAYGPETGVVFSPDGKRLAGRGRAVERTPEGNGSGGVVRVWDLAGGGASKEYDAEHAIWVGWSADGEPLAVCLEKGALRLDEPVSGRSRRFACENLREAELSEYITCCCAPAGKVLAISDEHGVIHVWDSTTGRPRCTIRPGGAVSSLALAPDGRTLASLNSESVRLWDATTGQALHTVAAGQKYLDTVAFTPDGKTLATAGWSDIRFWDVATGRYLGRTQDTISRAPSIAFSSDGKTLATAERDGESAVGLWDVATGKRKPQPVGHRCRPHGAAFSPDGRRVATGGGLDGTIQVWDLATGEPLAQVRRPGKSVRDLAFSPDGVSLFSAWTDENLWVCDATTGERRHVIKLEDPDRPDTRQSAISMYPSADGKTLVALSYYYPRKGGGGGGQRETLITGWDTSTRRQLFRRRRPDWDSWLALSPDCRVLAAPFPGGAAKRELNPAPRPIRLEDVATGALLLTFPTLDGQTWPLAFSPDGRLLASNNYDHKRQGKAGDPAAATGHALRLWEIATAAEVLALPAGWPDRAAFSPDGRLLAVVAPEQEILVWDLAHGREQRRFRGFDGEVTCLAFAPDGRRLISGLTDSTLLVWDAGPRETAPAGKLGAEGLAKAWADLAGSDAPRAFRARGALANAPNEALPLLKERVRPARPADAERLRRWLADLDSDRFELRDRAQAALEEQGELAEAALRAALTDGPTPEVRRRVQALLDGLRGPVGQPEARRSLRAVAVLEDIGTPEARQILKEVATGAPEARLTREAKASRTRLARRPGPAP